MDIRSGALRTRSSSRREQSGVACACVVLATTRLDVNHKVCELLGVRRASFAGADEASELTGMMIGGVTPFALPDHLPVYVDARVTQQPWVIIGGGNRSMKLRVRPDALLRIRMSGLSADWLTRHHSRRPMSSIDKLLRNNASHAQAAGADRCRAARASG